MKKYQKNKSKNIIITFILCIILLTLFSTIAYSAFSSTMNITGLAHSRVEADVRITDFSLNEIVNATSSYEDFSKNTVSSGIKLQDNTSSITYKIEVTNYGTTDIAISNITGLLETLSYTITDYNLKDKICDVSGKCNTLVTKEFYITITNNTNNTIETSLELTLIFEIFHKITYINIENNNHPTEVLNGEKLEVNLSSNPPKLLLVKQNNIKINPTYTNNILTINSVTGNIEIEGAYTTEFNYSYTGTSQEFSIPNNGIYKIELWGASGGNLTYASGFSGGKGGYVSGKIELQKNNKLYVYVGENYNGYKEAKSFNGGGNGNHSTSEKSDGSNGGGATDIRLTNGSWDDFNSLKSRIIIAAGGGGMSSWSYEYWGSSGVSSGGAAGGLTGYGGSYKYNGTHDPYTNSTGGTQTLPGNTGNNPDDGTINNSNFILYKAKFGVGGYSTTASGTIVGGYVYMSGGGGGYYGGGAGNSAGRIVGSAAGGSSFISGHNGCDAIVETSTSSSITHTGQSIHYSGYKFTDTIMVDGQGYNWTTTKGSQTGMPTQDGTSTMTGNTGNGYAKITLLELI